MVQQGRFALEGAQVIKWANSSLPRSTAVPYIQYPASEAEEACERIQYSMGKAGLSVNLYY